MTNREWKPGDVALVRALYGPDGDGEYRMVRGRTGWMLLDDMDWYWADSPGNVEGARPLVVIDPEDREQVERLRGIVDGPDGPDGPFFSNDLELWQAALREFANLTPPKPDEPTGLGAVVEDAEGVFWVRRSTTRPRAWGCSEVGGLRQYADIAAVKVLSEGVK